MSVLTAKGKNQVVAGGKVDLILSFWVLNLN